MTASLTPGRRIVGVPEQASDDGQLLAGPLLVERLEPEALGHERQRAQRPSLQGRVVEVVKVVNDMDAPAALAEQTLDKVRADEARAARDENILHKASDECRMMNDEYQAA